MGELEMLERLKYKHIVGYLGFSCVDDNIHMFLEYVAGGSLCQLISNTGMKQSLVQNYTEQILKGLAYLHENNVVHRDLKPANILVSPTGVLKLADFGTAADLSNVDINQIDQQTLCGTPAFIAPEVIRKEMRTTASDIWSLGVTVFRMVSGKLPFRCMDVLSLLRAIANGEINTRRPNYCTPEAGDFIERCLTFEPELRPSAEKLLLLHPMIVPGSDAFAQTPPRVSEVRQSMIQAREVRNSTADDSWVGWTQTEEVEHSIEPTLSRRSSLQDLHSEPPARACASQKAPMTAVVKCMT